MTSSIDGKSELNMIESIKPQENQKDSKTSDEHSKLTQQNFSSSINSQKPIILQRAFLKSNLSKFNIIEQQERLEEEKARIIQKIYRARIQKRLEQNSATKIQKRYKEVLDRRKFKKLQHEKAITIQRAFRNKLKRGKDSDLPPLSTPGSISRQTDQIISKDQSARTSEIINYNSLELV